ncbi:MAG: phage tail tape measure protein [Bacteroidales bacterium]|nr:phage tail tape measure protein [Bacteroidales bacterium]
MAQSEIARAEVILNGQKANATLKELENATKALNAELRKLPTNSAEFTKKTEEFQKVKNRLSEVKQEIMGTQSAMGKFADWTNKYLQSIALIGAAFAGASLAIKGMVDSAGKLSDSLANIRKTTGMTADEVSRLNSEFKKIDTRTSRQELREIANVAGQLGIEKKSIFDFTEAIDKLNVALGDEIIGGAEAVASIMGTLRNVLTDMRTKDVSDDLLRLGNAINDLSAAGFATAPVLTDFANRIGGVGINLGLSSDEVLGLSATMQELAISTERGGTAMVKILAKMTTNTDEFAKVAGLPLEEFTKLVNTDLYNAFFKVLEGSRRSGEGATYLGRMIKEMEISGIGAAEVFSKLGNNTAMLTEKVNMAGASLQNTNGVMAEFNIKNTTLGATLDKLGKEFNSLMASATLISILKSGVDVAVDLVAWLKVLPKTIKDNIVALTLLSGAVLIWIAAATRSMQISALNILLMKEGILLRIKDAVVLEALIIKERLYAFAKSQGTIATKIATVAQWAWNAAMTANPIGVVIAAVTALVAALKYYETASRSAINNEAVKISSMNRMEAINKLLSSSYDALNGSIRTLNQLSIQEKADLKTKIADSIKLAEVELAMMQARQQKVKQDNSKATPLQQVWNYVKSSSAADGTAMNMADGLNNGAKAAKELDSGVKELRTNLDRLKETQKEVLAITNAESVADSIHGKSLDNLEEKLNKLQIARKNTIAGSEDYIRIQNKIKEVQKEIAVFDTSDKTSDEEKKRLAKEALKTTYEKLGEEIKKYVALLQQQVIADPKQAAITAERIKSLQKEKEKVDALVESLVDLKKAGKTSYEKINEEIKKFNALLQDQVINDPAQAAVTAERIKKLNEEKKAVDELVASLTQPDDLTDWMDKYFNDRPMSDKETWDVTTGGLLGSFDSPDDGSEDPKMKEERESYEANKWAKDAEKVVGYVSMVKDTLGSLDDWYSSRENMELARDQALNEKKEKNLKGRLKAGLITQKQYDEATAKNDAALAAKKRKIEHDQAVRAKAMAVLQAGINVALGITSALSTIPAGFALAIVTGILGAIQIAAILAAPVPQAAKGRYNVTGRDDGRLYNNVPWVGPASTGLYSTPTLISEAGPEYVIDAKTTKNLQMNYPGVIDAINFARVPQFASGSYPQSGNSPSAISQNQGSFENGLLSALNEFNTHARNGIRTFLVYDDVRDSASTINDIENDVKSI